VKHLIAIFTFLFIHSSLFADEFLHVVTEDWKPYNFDDKGVIKGESTENVEKVLKRAGIAYQINLYPWSRGYKMALNNKNTLIYTIVRMPAREGQFIWSRPILDTEFSSLYRLKDRKDVMMSHLEMAREYKIGVIKDSMNYFYFQKRGFAASLVPVSTNHTQNVLNLLQGDIDLMASSDKHFSYAIKTLGVHSDVFEKVFPLFVIHPYMAFSHNTSPIIIDKINHAYDELVKEGQIKRFK
jgi:polar amino acid transport system substrate-binding protein